MNTRDIRAHLRETYGVEVSRAVISRATDAVVHELAECQARPLDAVYPVGHISGACWRQSYPDDLDAGHLGMPDSRSLSAPGIFQPKLRFLRAAPSPHRTDRCLIIRRRECVKAGGG